MESKNQAQELLDVALHPVRMRILTQLAGSQGLTPQQMAERMSDVAPATLYRHINRLAKVGLIKVVDQRPVRGTVEKVYAPNTSEDFIRSGTEAAEAFNRLSDEDHLRYFTSFIMSLLDDYSRYLHATDSRTRNMSVDGVGYQKLSMYMNDEEFVEFANAINQALLPFVQLQAAPGRKNRLFSTILMPSGNSTQASGSDEENKQSKE